MANKTGLRGSLDDPQLGYVGSGGWNPGAAGKGPGRPDWANGVEVQRSTFTGRAGKGVISREY